MNGTVRSGSWGRSIFPRYLHAKQDKDGDAAGFSMPRGDGEFGKSCSLLEHNSSKVMCAEAISLRLTFTVFQGVIWEHNARLKRPRGISVLFSHRHARFIAQPSPNRFHSSLQMGHRDNLFTERGSTLVGRQRSRYTVGKGEHLVYGHNNIRRGKL